MWHDRKLDAEIAFPAQCELAEGPVWDAARGLLRWVDILPGEVHALDPVSGEHSSFGTGQTSRHRRADPRRRAGPRPGGRVRPVRPGGQDLRPFGDFSVDASVTRFNDGKPDPWGSFWAGTMAVPEDSGYPCSLYRLSPDGAVTELFGGVGLSNGLDWSDDRRVFYYSDSHAGVDVFDTDPDTGALSARRALRRGLRRPARRPDPGRGGRPVARRLGLAASCAATPRTAASTPS